MHILVLAAPSSETYVVASTSTLPVRTGPVSNLSVCAYDIHTVQQVNKGMYDSSKTLASKDQAKGFPVARPVSEEA